MTIIRIEGKYPGYQARVQRKGKRLSRFFSDKAYGTEFKALLAAEKQELKWQRKRRKTSANNTSGLVGVNESFKTHDSGRTYHVVQVHWRESGYTRGTCYSVAKWGLDTALDMAAAIRSNKAAKLTGMPPVDVNLTSTEPTQQQNEQTDETSEAQFDKP